MSNNMYDMTGWQKVDCSASEAVLAAHPNRSVGSSLTDMGGEFGYPVIFTEWWNADDEPVARNYLWLQNPTRVCEHYIPEDAAR